MSAILTPILLLAITVCLVGSFYRLFNILKTPIARPIAITPAAKSRWGVLGFMLIETLTFRSLFKASFVTWVFGWLFHICLLFTLLIHLRFVSVPAPNLTVWLMPYTSLISYGLVLGLVGLLIRRLFVDRVRYVSSLSDYMHIILLLFIAAIGILMAARNTVNVYEVMLFVQGLFTTGSTVLATNYLLFMHVLGACVLLLIYPFSKLFHGPLLWFNPTRSQPRRPRS